MYPSPTPTRRAIALLVLCLGLTAWAGCDSNGEDDRCELFQVCDVETELSVALIESRTRLPANVSILFKVDTDEGFPIAALDPANFDIFENDALVSQFESQRNILPKVGQFTYSIALLLDLSGSITASENLTALKAAAIAFVEATMFDPDDPRFGEVEMSISWFDGQSDITTLVATEADPGTLTDGIASITENIVLDNSTNLYGAVMQGVEATESRLASISRQNIISAGSVVIFTDGTDQANRVSRRDALDAVRHAPGSISVYTIGLGGEIDVETLTEIGADGFVSATNLAELVPRFREIADLVRDEANSYYLLEYCSPKRDGDNDLTIRVNAGNAVGILSTEFSAKNFTSGCTVAD